MKTISQKLYLFLWMFFELSALLWPYFGGRKELAVLLAVQFLVCVPFLLLLPLFSRLRNAELVWAWGIYLFVSLALYLGLPLLGEKIGMANWQRIFGFQGISPWLLQMALLAFALVLVAVAQTLRKSYDRLELRKGARDREELETFYEMKIAKLPEDGLSPFRYKELLRIGVSFVAARKNRIEAGIQLLPFGEVFFLYDLCPGLEEEADSPAIDFLLQQMFFRPEIQLNRPAYLVYVARQADQIWEQKLRQAGFAPLPLEAPLAKKLTAILAESFAKSSLPKFDGWQPLAQPACLYLFSGQPFPASKTK